MTQTVHMRASSIAAFFDCPLRWASIHLFDVPALPSTAPAAIGTACHAGTAAYDQARLDGNPIKPDDAAGVVVDSLRNPEEDVDWGKVTPKEAERRALGVLTRYCSDVAPQIQYESVEQTLEMLVVEFHDYDVEIQLTGTLDRIYLDSNQNALGVLDIKTGARVCSQKPGKHKAQLATYELLAEHSTGRAITLPGKIGQLQTSSEYKVDVVDVPDTRLSLLGTDDQPGLLEHAARMFQTGDFFGNSSSWLCSDKYCPVFNNCIFR